MADDKLPYDVTSFDVVAEVPNLRVIVMELSAGQDVPWHYHTTITDAFYCLAGPMVIEYGNQGQSVTLNAGDSHRIPPGMRHRTRGANDGPCRFLIVHGIGPYDFIPMDEQQLGNS